MGTSNRYLSPEIDIITGGPGGDDFFLCGAKSLTPAGFRQGPSGLAFGGDHQIRYLDGLNSYALITDFDSKEGDKIILGGDRYNYGLDVNYTKGSVVFDDTPSTGIYVTASPKNTYNPPALPLPSGSPNSQIVEEKDLIAVLLGVTVDDFSLESDVLIDATRSDLNAWYAVQGMSFMV